MLLRPLFGNITGRPSFLNYLQQEKKKICAHENGLNILFEIGV